MTVHFEVLGVDFEEIDAEDAKAIADSLFDQLRDRGYDTHGVAPVLNADVHDRHDPDGADEEVRTDGGQDQSGTEGGRCPHPYTALDNFRTPSVGDHIGARKHISVEADCTKCGSEVVVDAKVKDTLTENPDVRTDGGEDIESEWTLVCLDCEFEDEMESEGHPRDGPPRRVRDRVLEHKGRTDESHIVRVEGRRAVQDRAFDPSLATDGGRSLEDRLTDVDGDDLPTPAELAAEVDAHLDNE